MKSEQTNGGHSEVAWPRDVTFHTLTSQPLEARIEAVSTDTSSPHGATIRGRFTMSFDAFRRALASESFHLFAEVMPGVDLSTLDEKRPVEIYARLRRDLARPFVERGATDSVAALAGAFATAFGDTHSEQARRLLCTESWLALSATQEVSLPDDIPTTAITKLGVETSWNTILGGRAPDSMIAVATTGLRARGHHIEFVQDGLMRTAATAGAHSWALLVHVDEDQRTCICWSVYPDLVAPEKRAAVAQFLVEYNYDAWIGGFEMDPSDGEIRYRTSVDLGGAPLDARLFERLVSQNIEGMAHVYPLLSAYFKQPSNA